jgi:hypothetical protein
MLAFTNVAKGCVRRTNMEDILVQAWTLTIQDMLTVSLDAKSVTRSYSVSGPPFRVCSHDLMCNLRN